MSGITRTDVITAYELLLRREPESEEVISLHREHHPSMTSLVREIVLTPEFAQCWGKNPCFCYHAVFDPVTILRSHERPGRSARPGHIVNFLGVAMNLAFVPFLQGYDGLVEGLPIPANWHADMAEFAAALRAVDLAHDRFTMIELGCGWGCWMNNTGVAAKRRGLAVHVIGVEGDEGHLAFAHESLATNGFGWNEFTLHHGIAAARAGTALFPRQNEAGSNWGLEPLFDLTPEALATALGSGRFDELPVLALDDIIGPEEHIDLLHIDIQGGEGDLVRDCLATLTARVAYLVIGTHSRILEGRLMSDLLAAGWAFEIERPAVFTITPAGPVTTIDGVQGWRNPYLTGCNHQPAADHLPRLRAA